MDSFRFSRRLFLAAGASLSGGLVVGALFNKSSAEIKTNHSLDSNENYVSAWVNINPDNSIELTIPRVEMGQGTYTSLSQLVAEELDVSWDSIRVSHAPVNRLFSNVGLFWDGTGDPPGTTTRTIISRIIGTQMTGGSSSIRDGWSALRPAGATARALLIRKAAEKWGVEQSECTTNQGVIIHKKSEKSATYGEIATIKSDLKIPKNVSLLDPSLFKIIGKSVKRIDTKYKINGSAGFGIDIQLPGMLLAAILHCPSFGGQILKFDQEAIESRNGVVKALQINNSIVVVSKQFWVANQALQDAQSSGKIVFTSTEASSQNIFNNLEEALSQGKPIKIEDEGDVEVALSSDDVETIEAQYYVPFLPHAAMEPMNCTAKVEKNSCEIWTGTQVPDSALEAAAAAASVSKNNTIIHNQFLGGGFGRRAEVDVITEAVQIANQFPGIPIKLIWSREEDMSQDYYRPAAMARLTGNISTKSGNISAWKASISSAPMNGEFAKRNMGPLIGSIASRVADRFEIGGAVKPIYTINNRKISWSESKTVVPTGTWRSVSHSFGAFFSESFVDELANSVNQDPYKLRSYLLQDKPRHLYTLNLAAEKSEWEDPLGKNQGRGIAIHESFGSIVCQVVEVTISPQDWIKVDRVVTAIDVGFPINPEGIKSQVESSIIYGLSAALFGEITVKDGAVQEKNFDTVEVLRIFDSPIMETHIVNKGGPIGGAGEPGLPPIAPALTNAIFSASGKRVRSLPIYSQNLS